MPAGRSQTSPLRIHLQRDSAAGLTGNMCLCQSTVRKMISSQDVFTSCIRIQEHCSIWPAVSHLLAACSPLLIAPAVRTDAPPLFGWVDLEHETGAMKPHWARADKTSRLLQQSFTLMSSVVLGNVPVIVAQGGRSTERAKVHILLPLTSFPPV